MQITRLQSRNSEPLTLKLQKKMAGMIFRTL